MQRFVAPVPGGMVPANVAGADTMRHAHATPARSQQRVDGCPPAPRPVGRAGGRWAIEAHRFRLGHQELDLVARRGGLVAFVEVKTRTSSAWGAPAESIQWRKRRTITRVAEVWRERHGRVGDVFRFDVIEVRAGKTGEYRIEHLEDAWRGGR